MIKIAIDGTAASGKGTLAKKLAEKYDYIHLDTGLLYRKVAKELIIKNKNTSENLEYYSSEIAKNLNFLELKKEDLRSEEIAKLASLIATYVRLHSVQPTRASFAPVTTNQLAFESLHANQHYTKSV